MKQREVMTALIKELADTREEMDAALAGDSNDAEHDALYAASESLQDIIARLLPLAAPMRTTVDVKWGYVDDGGNSSATWTVEHRPGVDVRAALIAAAQEYNATEESIAWRIEDITKVFDLDAALLAKHGIALPDEANDAYVEIDEYPAELAEDDEETGDI